MTETPSEHELHLLPDEAKPLLRDVRSDVHILERRIMRLQSQIWNVSENMTWMAYAIFMGWVLCAALFFVILRR